SAPADTLPVTFAAVQAAPNISARQSLPDPAGEKNIGNGAGAQFIGGQCQGAADCASGCCATLPQGGQTIGVCSGVGAQTQAGKQGCGFESGDGKTTKKKGGNNKNQNNNGGGGGGGTVQPTTLVQDPAGAANVGNGAGAQFITGGCTSDADCASGCCALVNTGVESFGICSGPAVSTQNGKQGCGFPVGGG
ncbi:hypothetical protein BT67DRAFT_376694, partial [Trichocladium antarcticum]